MRLDSWRLRLPLLLALVLLLPCCSDPPAAPPPTDGGGDGDGGADTGSSPARLLVYPAALDLGAVECGTTPKSQTLTLTNLGHAPLTWSAALSAGAPFSISGQASGTIGAQASTKLTLLAQPLPASASPGAALTATLTLDTNDAYQQRHSVPLSLTPTGAILGLSPLKLDLGLIPLGASSTDQAITLSNSGDKEVTITIAQPADKQFTLSWTGAPAPVKLAAGASVPGLTARFSPTSAGVASTSAALNVSGAVCGTGLSTIALKAEGSVGKISVQPGALDFGKVDCGKTAAAQTLKVTNAGSAAFTLTAVLAAGAASPYAISPASAVVAVGGSLTVTVTPKPVPAASLTTADLHADTLTLSTTIPGDTPHAVKLHQTARGARLSFDRTVIAFGGAPLKTTVKSPLAASNDGNAPATVTLKSTGYVFSISPASATVLAAGATLSASASFSPTTAQIESGSVALAAASGDVLCAPLPPSVALFGEGTNGAIAISDTSLDFDTTPCGGTAAPQSLTVQNTGNSSFSFSAALARGAASPYAVAPASGTLAPAASVTITVTPKAVPASGPTTAGAFDDTLTITTSGIVGDSPHPIKLEQSATGVLLVLQSGSSLAMGNVPAGSTSSATFSLVNQGSDMVDVTLAVSNKPIYTLDDYGPVNLDSNEVHQGTIDFEPTAAGAQTASVSFTVPGGTVLCGPLPGLAVTGTGTNGTVALSTSQLDFGLVNCGAQAAAKSVVISNTGTAAFNFTADLDQTSAEAYTLGAAGGKVDPGQQVTLTVTPPAIPADSAVTANLYGDQLTVSTDVFGDVDHLIPIKLTARGAILALSPGTLSFADTTVGSSASLSFSVGNSGNAPATVSFAITKPVFSISPQGHAAAAGASYGATAYFSPSAAAVYSEVVQVSVPAGTAICDALPTLDLDGEGI